MKRLVNTQLFCLLKKIDGTFNPSEQEFSLVYDDFIYTVTSLCTSQTEEIPAYFIIHYTRLELYRIQAIFNNKRLEKKSSYTKLHRS